MANFFRQKICYFCFTPPQNSTRRNQFTLEQNIHSDQKSPKEVIDSMDKQFEEVTGLIIISSVFTAQYKKPHTAEHF